MSDKPSHMAPRISLSPIEGRLYIVALLASGYLITWGAIEATNTPSRSVMAPSPISNLAGARPSYIWLDDVVREHRPVISLPPGWQLASHLERATTAPVPRVTRIPASRPMRVRTRSS